MNDLFPYVGKTVTVTKDMCDFNGHMNVNYIKEVFEQAWEFANEEFGLNEEYLATGVTFTQKSFLIGKIFYNYAPKNTTSR